MWKEIYPFLLTIASSVIIFVIGQMTMEVYIKPYIAYKKLKSRISCVLVMHANRYANPIDLKDADPITVASYEKVSTEIRALAAELTGFIEEVPRLRLFIPSKMKLSEAASMLIGLSNGLFHPYGAKDSQVSAHNRMRRDTIVKMLSLYSLREE